VFAGTLRTRRRGLSPLRPRWLRPPQAAPPKWFRWLFAGFTIACVCCWTMSPVPIWIRSVLIHWSSTNSYTSGAVWMCGCGVGTACFLSVVSIRVCALVRTGWARRMSTMWWWTTGPGPTVPTRTDLGCTQVRPACLRCRVCACGTGGS